MAFQPINISTPNDGLGDPLRSSFDLVNQMFEELYDKAVFKEPGKGLSTNDFTDEEQTKLEGIQENAEVNVNADLLQEDPTEDSFVYGKEAFFIPERTPPIITYFDGGFDFDLPEGKIVNSVMLVRTMLFESTEWSQFENTLTIGAVMEIGNRVQINFY